MGKVKAWNVYKIPTEHQHSWALGYLHREVTSGEFNAGGRYKHLKHKLRLVADFDTKEYLFILFIPVLYFQYQTLKLH